MANQESRSNQTPAPRFSPSSASPDATAPAPTTSSSDQLLAAFMQQMAAQQAQIAELMQQQAKYNEAALRIAPRRKKSMQEYLAERHKAGRAKFLPHLVYQNGREVNPSGLSQETINLLDTLATGLYCDNLVEVVRVTDGPGGVNSRIHLRYNNGTVEERMMFYMRFRTFTEIVRAVADEMKERNIAPVIEKGRDAPTYEFPESL